MTQTLTQDVNKSGKNFQMRKLDSSHWPQNGIAQCPQIRTILSQIVIHDLREAKWYTLILEQKMPVDYNKLICVRT